MDVKVKFARRPNRNLAQARGHTTGVAVNVMSFDDLELASF